MKKYLCIILFSITILFTIYIFKLVNKNSNIIYRPETGKMIVYYLDVGQGDCILIQVNKKNLLIDSGPKSDKKKLLDSLSKIAIDKLDYVIATHPHEDHIGNMSKIIDNYKVLNFYSPKVQTTTKTFEEMIDSLKSKSLKINIIKKGIDSIDLGENTKVTVFSPTKEFYEDLNNYSPVIKIQYGKTSFLFTGDAQKEVEKELITSHEDIGADVLKIGHHGSSTSSTKEFLNKVNPSLSVISVGSDNSYNHPNTDTIKRLKENEIRVYRTDIDSTVIITSDGSNISKK
ncbi:ComEC/Rec2 family competence protein [Clostridium sp. C2-6-12]|uniref:ComEC/Rec2 family competence protein n=1 Tax=Clostridium sp. C2-6-12 TaxID=2698832 RepID=UPI00136BBDA5|nr:ComEC/Rec2 family competence protein [Clostridium sp. C2-6-12]